MADRYIDVAYVDACMGASVRAALVGEGDASDLIRTIERGTSLVKGYLRNSGYQCPATQDPDEIDDDTVKDAVMCCVWEILVAKPDNSLPLPVDWKTMPYRLALEGILSGAVQLNLPQSVKSAPGGITVGSSTSRARQSDLDGW